MNDNANSTNPGTVVFVRGSVADIRFDGHLPPIYSVLRAGAEQKIVIEVLAQRDARHVRGIALTATQGLARGMAEEDTSGPQKAPVGRGILSRMVDVLGNAIDREPASSDVQWRSVHRAPPPLARRSTKSEILEKGIKVIDVLVPLERGGEAGLFGGAGVGTTVLLTEMIHNMIGPISEANKKSPPDKPADKAETKHASEAKPRGSCQKPVTTLSKRET